jgi:glycosyltransferase involved in cell wall biosynthesis
MSENMKASVLIVTYNHEPYIEQSVRSVLAQRSNFDYEIIIGEDCSTDRTREILIRLQEQFPDRIRLLANDHNLGMIQNSLRTLAACHGEYISLLDGDDYWCGEDKLQRQVDFLDQHPDFAISFHSVLKVNENSSQQPKVVKPAQDQDVFDINDLIRSMFIPTCSALFRNGLIDEFPSWTGTLKLLDWLIFILVARSGKIGYANDVMAVYRVHSSGWWSSMEPMKRLLAIIDFFEKLNPYLEFQYDKTIRSTLSHHWRKLMDELYDLAILQPTVEAAKVCVNETTSSVANFESIPARWEQELWERIYCYFLMTNYEIENYPAAWSAWLGLMKNSPAMRQNRGLLLIGLGSMLNGRLRPLLRRF